MKSLRAVAYGKMLERVVFILAIVALFALAILKIKPDSSLWERPLAAHSYAHHHTIISVLDNLYRDKDFLKGDLVVEAIKKGYFIPHKYLQIFLVNKIGIPLSSYINFFILAAIVINFIAIGVLAYWFTQRRVSILLALFCFVMANGHVSLKDAPDNFPRFLAQGVCFISLWLFLKKHYLSSLCVCFAAFLFHYGMPFYLLLLFFFYLFFQRLSSTGKNLFMGGFVFSVIFLAGVILLPKNILTPGMNDGFTFELWKRIVYDTGPFWSYIHLNISGSFGEAIRWLFYNLKNIVLNLMLIFFFFWVGMRELKQKNMLKYIFIAYVMTQIIHFFVFDVSFLPILVRTVIMNTWFYMPYFMLFIYVAVLTKYFYKDKLSYYEVVVVFLFSFIYFLYNLEIKKAVSFPIMFFLVFLFIAIYRKGNLFRSKEKTLISGRAAFTVLFILIFIFTGIAYCYKIKEMQNCVVKDKYWLDAQLWVEKNTDKDARIIIPFSDDYLHGMRIYGKRSVMCLKAMELHFLAFLEPGLTINAIREFTSPWDVPKKNGIPLNFFKYNLLEYSKSVGNNLNREDLLLLKKNQGRLSHIVTDGRDIPGLRRVYMNKYYKIFEIK